MEADRLLDGTLVELCEALQSRRVTPVQVVDACLDRIRRWNPAVNAFVSLCEERARKEAQDQTSRFQRGEYIGPLMGVPFGVKDLEDAAGLPTTYGTRVFASHVATEDSVQVARLRAAGAIVVGKTNTPVFGSTAFTKNLLFGATRNPWNLSRTPGGSSGGSAAAIASRMVPLVTASDGGGSVRIPASFVGAFGMKPTFGMIPIDDYGMFKMRDWLPCVHYGPITRCVADAALFLDVTCGYHPSDPTSLPHPGFQFAERLSRPPKKSLRIAFSRHFGYLSNAVQSDVLEVAREAAAVFEKLGYKVDDVDLQLTEMGMYWPLLMGAQTYAAAAKMIRGHEDIIEKSFVGSFDVTSQFSIDDMGDAMRFSCSLNDELRALFSRYDILLSPAMPIDPFSANGPIPKRSGDGVLESPEQIAGFTYPFNFSGHPAAVVRAGFSRAKLPVGLQIIGERYQDEVILQLCYQFEKHTRAFDSWPSMPAIVANLDSESDTDNLKAKL